MTVLFPNDKIAARWNGALEMRLRHASLELFLTSRGRKWLLSGEARVSDNLACATVYFIDRALDACTPEGSGVLGAGHHAAVGQAACAVSHGLARLIQEANSWRIAALIGTARTLAPYIGPDASAHLSATCARDYAKGLKTGGLESGLLRIGMAAAAAVESNNHELAGTTVQLIAQSISPVPCGSLAKRAAPR